MMSQQKFKEKHRVFMDADFIKKNPEGRFAIQRRGINVNIYVNFERRTAWNSSIYPKAFGIESSSTNHFYFISYQNNSFGKVTHYNSLDKFIKACMRYNVRDAAVETFLFYYNKRSDADFVAEVKKRLGYRWTFKKGMEMAIISEASFKKEVEQKSTEKETFSKLCE